jgi:hypothetical protein
MSPNHMVEFIRPMGSAGLCEEEVRAASEDLQAGSQASEKRLQIDTAATKALSR